MWHMQLWFMTLARAHAHMHAHHTCGNAEKLSRMASMLPRDASDDDSDGLDDENFGNFDADAGDFGLFHTFWFRYVFFSASRSFRRSLCCSRFWQFKATLCVLQFFTARRQNSPEYGEFAWIWPKKLGDFCFRIMVGYLWHFALFIYLFIYLFIKKKLKHHWIFSLIFFN